MNLRPLRPDEADHAAQVHFEAHRATFRGLYTPEQMARKGLAARVAEWRALMAPPATGVVALGAEPRPGVLVGVAAGGPPRNAAETGADAHIHQVYLLPAYRGQGTGRGLVEVLALGLRRAGHRSATLATAGIHAEGRAFWEHLGARFLRESREESEVGTLWRVDYVFDDLAAIGAATRRDEEAPGGDIATGRG